METVFLPGADGNVLNFLNANKERVKLLAATEFVARLYYLGRDTGNVPNFEFEVLPISVAALKEIKRADESGGGEFTYVVADAEGEGKRLKDLQQDYPNVTFAGLGCDLLPAALAQSANVIFSGNYPDMNVRQLNLVFATPRSGSSLVSDIIRDLGGGSVREHLRETLLEVLASDYRFDRLHACRRFLTLAANGEHCGSKLITHFVEDYIQLAQGFGFLEVFSGLKVKAIFLDRADKVDQAISSYLASSRGIWHITSDKAAAEIEAKKDVPFNFAKIYARYFSYQRQSAVLNQLKAYFPDRLELIYEQDVEAGDLESLATRLAEFLGLDRDGKALQVAKTRQKITSAENSALKAEFENRYKQVFVCAPAGNENQGR